MSIQKFQLKENILLLFIFSFAAFLYLFNIGYSDIWVDETFTRELVKKPLDEFFGLLSNDFHPPLYFLGLKLFTSIFGTGGFSMRLFSVIGAFLTLVLSYTVGRKVFGKKGALYFCLLLLPIPMLAFNAQIARMYTWSVFFSTGVFLYACLFIKSGKTKDLILLGIFSLFALYTHYYCIMGAFWANIFVFVYLLIKRKPYWKAHLIMNVILLVLFFPWLLILFKHIGAANEGFWIPPPSFQTFFQCYTFPFALKLTVVKTSYILLTVVYLITLISIITTYKKLKKGNMLRIALSLSLVIYNTTILTALVISLFSQSILYYRYVMTVVSMLMVPLTIFLINYNNRLLKYGLLILIFGLSTFISIKATYYSFGPYKQTIERLQNTHPEIKKIIYQSEVSLGPMVHYSTNDSLQHYWLENDNSVYFTNLEVFEKLHIVNTLDEMLTNDEIFCFAGIWRVPLNPENYELILSKNNLISTDTIIDSKDPGGMQIVLHYLQYQQDENNN